MKASDYLRESALRIARQEAADAKKRAAIIEKRLNLAGDELVATQSDLATIAETSTEPAVQSLAESRKTSINGTLVSIKRPDEVLP